MCSKNKANNKAVLLPDEPLHNARKFGFEEYAKTLTRLIAGMDVLTPITISIHGDWGSGKSSLMKTIANLLKHEEAFEEYFAESERFPMKKSKIIWFNAWEYESEEDIALVLLQYIANELEKEVTASKLEKLEKYLGALARIAVDVTLKKIGGISLEEVQNYVKNEYKKLIGDLSSLSRLHEEVIQEYIEKNDFDQVVIFIDDLDRCSIENSKSIIDAVKLFLTTKNCVFILGLDIEKLQRSLDLKYKNIKGFDAREYIDKIVQLRFDLPPLSKSDIKDYVKNLLPEDYKGYSEIIAEGVPSNPRSVKLFINNLRFQLALSKYRDFEINEPLLIKWLILKHSFPSFAIEIERNPKLFSKYQSEEIVSTYKNLPPDEKNKFLEKENLNADFLENDKLLKVLQVYRIEFTEQDLKDVIFQTKSARVAEELDEEVKALIVDIGHYFFNPLTIAKGYLSLLKDTGMREEVIRPIKSYLLRLDTHLTDIIEESFKKGYNKEQLGKLIDELFNAHFNNFLKTRRHIEDALESVHLSDRQRNFLTNVKEAIERIIKVFENWQISKEIYE